MENFKVKAIEIVKRFVENQLLILVGFEFEFFIVNSSNEEGISYINNLYNKKTKSEFLEKANEILKKNQFNGSLVEERGSQNQFEIISEPSPDPWFDFLKMKKFLEELDEFIKSFFENQNYKICTLAKPFINEVGNVLHFHISVNKIPSLENIFETNDDFSPFLRNKFMAKIVGVLMHDLKKNIKTFFISKSTMDRVDSTYIPGAPSNLSWGKNNKTTAIRIPDEPSRPRTIEFRVPSSENDFDESLYFVFKSCFKAIFQFDEFLNENSLNEKNFLREPTIRIAFDEQYNLKKFTV